MSDPQIMELVTIPVPMRTYTKKFRTKRLTRYLSEMTQRFLYAGFDDPLISNVFKKYPLPTDNELPLVDLPWRKKWLDQHPKFKELDIKITDALRNVKKPYSPKKMNYMLKLVKQSVIVSGTAVEVLLLVEKVRAMTINISEDAEAKFRNHPSSEYFFKWQATWRMIDLIGADLPRCKMPAHSSLNNKPYIVLTGDTLPKIAIKKYGSANLWDIIWFESGGNFHPDRIKPGQKLILP